MLSFFKKTSRSRGRNSSVAAAPAAGPHANEICDGSGGGAGGGCNGLDNHQALKVLSILDDEGLCDIGEFETTRERSRLSKTLSEVLTDKSALGYFIQYLEARNSLSYIRCWLDIENLRSSILQHEHQKRDDCRSLSIKVDHDSLSVSTDCDSFTADSVSLCDYSERSRLETEETADRYTKEITDDALRIFKKYVALEAPESIGCSDEMRNEMVENICTEGRLLTSDGFKNVQNYVFVFMEKELFEGFLCSDYFCKYQIDVLTDGSVALEDILYNETALFYFMEFLEQENRRNLLEFWLAASNFHQQLHIQKDMFDPIEAQNDAVILYDKYFSLQALCPLGFGDKIRFAVEQNICGENGLMHDCFHLPLKIIEYVLDKHYLKPFLASQLFYKYLSELINTVQSNGYCIYNKNKYASSECGSERSFSTHSFQAMENPNRRRKEKGADMNIDTRELYDPDALWRRKKFHRLSFGRVTELGKFVTDTEPQPEKSESMIKNVVKKFVNLEADKRKEELAWQVAEMIVKDITSITLSEQKT